MPEKKLIFLVRITTEETETCSVKQLIKRIKKGCKCNTFSSEMSALGMQILLLSLVYYSNCEAPAEESGR